MTNLSTLLHSLRASLASIGQAFAHLAGIDVFIERDTDGRFSRETHPAGDREYWGLGLHVVVSPLEMSPR